MKGPRTGLGWFGGVFTPSILTILGIILFLRLGFVVGNAGLVKALLIIGAATAVSVLTSISVAAIATNIEVGAGGDYYLISRTLGIEFGGAIGIVLFLAQSVSIGFYAVGFGEAVADVAGVESALFVQLIAAIAIVLLLGLAWAGADVATRFQYVVMAALIVGLVSFFAGAFGGASGEQLGDGLASPPDALGFWVVFAIFFPAVTGFTQGVSMSGDLKDPSRSLPIGTFLAVGLSTVVYVLVAILMAANASRAELIADTGAMGSISAVPALIDAGVIAATLSSAMASFLGAPRILQSLASDRIFPVLGFFAKGHGPSANPRRGVVLAFAIALGTVALGDLNAIAPVVSMFFLISYGLLNYATYYEARASSPAFRPRFRFFHRRTALTGSLLCLGAMIAISPVAGLAAVLVLGVIYQYLSRRAHLVRWADASRSHHFQRAKESIRAMLSEVDHDRYWRPQVLLFSADEERRERLLHLATWLEGRSGLTQAVTIIEGEGALDRKAREEAEEALRRQIDRLGLDVHARAVLAPDGLEALSTVAQSFGIGPLEANTALFGLPDAWPAHESYIEALRAVARFRKNVFAVTTDEARWAALHGVDRGLRRIDVWWNDGDAGRLGLLTAYLFTRTPSWSQATLHLVAPIGADQDPAAAAESLAEMCDTYRIPATPITVGGPAEMAEHSATASLVLFPMRIRNGSLTDQFGRDLGTVIRGLPMAAGLVAGRHLDLAAGPESGLPGRLAEAERAKIEASERAATLERQLRKVVREIADLRVLAADERYRSDRSRLMAAERRAESIRKRILSAKARAASAQEEIDRILEG